MIMNNFDAILLMAGTGSRFKANVNKALIPLRNKPLFIHSLKAILATRGLSKVFLVVNPNDINQIKSILNQENITEAIHFINGGNSRAESVRKALECVKEDKVIIHDSARPWLETSDIETILNSLENYDASTFYHDVHDTIKLVDKTIKTLSRNALKAVSTPQAFNRNTFSTILNPRIDDELITDEIKLLENLFSIGFIKEMHSHYKITIPEDLKIYEALRYNVINYNRVGQSFDFHPFVLNRPLILGGITLDYPFGLAGHSDADVVYHVVAESIIGALGLGDLGTLFPDNDDLYLGIASSYFVSYMKNLLLEHHCQIQNLDIMIYLEEPNLSLYKKKMAENIANLLNIKSELVNVKATTMEKKGRIGQKEGIACEAIVLLSKI